MIEVVQLVRGVLTIKVTGKLREADIDQLRVATDRCIRQWIKVRVLIILEGFEGFASQGLTEAGFMGGDGQAIEKMAVVGDDRCEDVVHLCFGNDSHASSIACFARAEREQAVIWIVDGL